MSILGKLAFWKHDDDLDLDSLASKDFNLADDPLSTPQTQQNNLNQERSPFDQNQQNPESSFDFSSFSQQNQNSSQDSFQELPPRRSSPSSSASSDLRELELINSKLDTLKAMLNNMEQRMVRLEQAAGTEQRKRLW